MGFRTCYLCSKKKENNLSLHGFPKDERIKQMWKSACNLFPEDDVTRLWICSNHFKFDDYQSTIRQNHSGRKYLKPKAIPSVALPNPFCLEIKAEHEYPSLQENNIDFPISLNIKSENEIEIVKTEYDIEIVKTENDIEIAKAENLNASFIEITYNDVGSSIRTQKNLSVALEPDGPAEEIRIKTESDFEHNENLITAVQTPKKRRVAEPRYVSEIQIEDVATPRGANRIIKLVKLNDAKKSKKIQLLQNQKAQLEKCINDLENQIADLHEKGIMTRGTGNALAVH